MAPGDLATAIIAATMGVAMAALWTRDIVIARQFDASRGRLRARTDAGELLVPHWVAEFATAALLVGAATLIVLDAASATVAAGVAAGALGYTSINSLGWALASRDRLPYSAPMIAGIAVAIWLALYAIVG